MSEAHRPRHTLRRIGAVLTALLAIVVIRYLSLYIVANRALNRTDIDAKQKTVTSKDGTLVAFEHRRRAGGHPGERALWQTEVALDGWPSTWLSTSRSSTTTAAAGAKARILRRTPWNVRLKISKL